MCSDKWYKKQTKKKPKNKKNNSRYRKRRIPWGKLCGPSPPEGYSLSKEKDAWEACEQSSGIV